MPDLTPLKDLQGALTPEAHISNAERLLLVADEAVSRGDFNHVAELAALAQAHVAASGQLTVPELFGHLRDIADAVGAQTES
jgi:hypothetical protein